MLQHSKRAGYTLVELMVVVTIIAILAVVALPAFSRYLNRARVTEGVAFIQEIRARQEAYRVDNGTYCRPATDNPTTVPRGGNFAAWDITSTDWNQLGAMPDNGQARFSYSMEAGDPGELPDPPRGYDGSDFWFIVRGTADLNGDGTTFFLEGYSAASHVYNSSSQGYD